MSPILVRPVREQLEHDRVIRLLQAKYKRKFEVAINPGNEQSMPVGTPPSVWYPDLVLQSTERSRKLMGTVEVETTESVNHLEAMSQWATFSRLRVPFHLYIPAGCVDSAKRLSTDLQVSVAEMWAYHTVGDQIRFTLVHRIPQPGEGVGREKVRSTEPGMGAPRPAPRAAAAVAVVAKPPAPVKQQAPAKLVAPAKSSVTAAKAAAPKAAASAKPAVSPKSVVKPAPKPALPKPAPPKPVAAKASGKPIQPAKPVVSAAAKPVASVKAAAAAKAVKSPARKNGAASTAGAKTVAKAKPAPAHGVSVRTPMRKAGSPPARAQKRR